MIQPISAFDPATTVVKANWLYVNAGDFTDTSPHSWENKITIQTGGEDLLEFENLGIVSEETSDTQVVYKARAKFGFEVTVHTSVDFRNFFPNINLAAQHEEWFFKVNHFYIHSSPTAMYSVKWNEVDYGSVSQWHDYIGSIPLTVGIKELTGTRGEIEINGVTISVPEYIPNTLQSQVTILRSGVVGDYNDIFTNVNDVEGGDVSLVVLDDFNEQQQAIINYYNDYNLGWSPGNVQIGQTLQQSLVSGAQGGATFHNQNPAANRFYTFNLGAEIQPEVYQYVQYNTLKKAEIVYWHYLFPGNIDPIYGPATESIQRVVGVHTTNYFLHWDLTVEVEFYATIPSTAELTQSILDDPYLKAGDMMWDTSIVGTHHVDLPLTTGDLLSDLMPWIILIIIIAVLALVIYLFIQVGMPLIISYAKAKSVRERLS